MASGRRSTKPGAGSAAAGGPLRRIGRRIGGRGRWYTKTLRWLLALGVVGVLAGALTFFVLYRAIAIPSANADFLTQTTKVYYSDGKRVMGTFSNQDRESIELDQVPASMQAAAIAAEDRTFYSNRGIDFKGIVRALRNNARAGEITGGGSTITQQYVKILYLTQEQSYSRKAKEAILSIKIHNQLSKDEILEGYLNTIYFGNGAYGVQVASQTYFNKPASKLNYAESALLATIINSPSYYDPYSEGAKDRTLPRFNYVLDGMLKDGAISSEEREKYRDQLPKVTKRKVSEKYGGPKGYLLQMVRDEMNQLDFTDSEVQGGGYRIVTTIDYNKQVDAEQAIKQFQPVDRPELNNSLVSIQPGSGAVRALYGGPDFIKKPKNWATYATQPGSTFKVFALIAALEDGYGLQTRLNGSSPLRVGTQLVENQGDSGGSSFGPVSLQKATQESINTAFVDLTEQMGNNDAAAGAGKVLKAAKEAGIPASVADKIDKVAVTSLGFAPVSPIDMANAYATVAAGGKRADWYLIDRVSTAQGTEQYKHETKLDRAFSERVAGDAIKALQSVVSGGTGTNGRTFCPTAGKTGTATFADSGNGGTQHVSSSWFAGFTPKLATTVMYNRGENGNGDLENYMTPIFYGGQVPARTFGQYMNTALQGSDCGSFVPPGNIQANKGTIYTPPKPTNTPTPTKTPKKPECASDEVLKGNKCEPKDPNPPSTCEPGDVGTFPDCRTPTEKPKCDNDPLTPDIPDCATNQNNVGGAGMAPNALMMILTLALSRRWRNQRIGPVSRS